MISIQAIMLVALGFLVAGFFALLIAPSYRRRAERLATEKLKRTMPLSEAEIRADKDRLRADYAIYIHELQAKVDVASDAAARQRIDLNRRDAVISSLEGELGEFRTSLEEHQNARRVLEQTIMDRLPKVEQRLQSAKQLLHQRDREVARLTETGDRQARALEEAQQINRKQRDETQRLEATLNTRSVRNRDGSSDARFDGEIALRSEIEALRSKTHDQAAVIARLQSGVIKTGGVPADESQENRDVIDEVARLSGDLASAEAALRAAQTESSSDRAGQATLQDEVRRLKSAAQDKDSKLAELEAALSTYRSAEKDNKVLAESKMALKAQAMSLQAQSTKQAEIIESLRAEVATANERLARQAKHFMDEMRRLGSGTVPAGGKDSAENTPQSFGVGKRAEVGSGNGKSRQSLTDRISEPRNPANPLVGQTNASARLSNATSKQSATSDLASVSDMVMPATGSGDSANDQAAASVTADASSAPVVGTSGSQSVSESAQARRRPGLMERITSLDKSKRSSKSA